MLKDKITYILKALRFILYPLYFFSFLIPKKKTIWVFGSHQNRFSENSKELFLYISNNHKEIQSIWITGDKELSKNITNDGYLAFCRWSLKGLYFSLRAKNYFYNVYSDDINFYTSGNATLVNLWHGIPLKHIEFDIKKGPLQKMFNSHFSFIYTFFKPYIFKKPHYVLSTSKTVSKIFASVFRVDESQCLEFGYPRTDIFFRDKEVYNDKQTALLYKKLKNLKEFKNHKIIIYMPTWRSKSTSFLKEALPNLKELNNTLASNTQTLIIKLHPNDFIEYKELSNILFFNPRSDIYPLLPLSDLLITDYSSIYFDYLLLNKEIIFYPFDLQSYLNEDREFYFDYSDKTPGIKVNSFNELLDTLSNADSLNFEIERTQIRDEFWTYQDADAAKRVSQYFLQKVL